jgi:Pyruvate/2-oxoacid:ferredoxin oxidoreductase gamma subunit
MEPPAQSGRVRNLAAELRLRPERSPVTLLSRKFLMGLFSIAAMKSRVDLLVAFDKEAVEIGKSELADDGLILYDSSSYQLDLPNAMGFPFATMAGSQIGQPIYKNTAAYGVISVLMGFDPVTTHAVIEERFKRRSADNGDR